MTEMRHPFVDGQSHCFANNAADAIITLSATTLWR